MFLPKPQIKNLYRIKSPVSTRRKYLRLDMNESVAGLPDYFVRKVLRETDGAFLATYPEYGMAEEKIALYNQLKAENICLSNGSEAAIKYIFDTYVSPGDKVLLTDPTFAMYPVYSRMFSAEILEVKYKQDFNFPKKEFLKFIGKNVKLAVIVNPHNPTGSIVEEDLMREILSSASKEGVLVIVDEAYHYFYDSTAIKLVKKYKNLIVLRSFSKLCGLAGLRAGYVAACPTIIRFLKKARPAFDINSLSVLFVQRLLEGPQIINSLIKSYTKGRDYLINKLTKSRIEFRFECGNFILINCGKRVPTVMNSLLKKEILVGGGFRQFFLKNYIRVTIADEAAMSKFWNCFIKIYYGALSNK